MNKDNIKTITKIAEGLEWIVTIDKDYILFSKESPAGQDFNVEMSIKATDSMDYLADLLQERYADFDVSEETYLWLDSSGHGIKSSPHDMRDLYNDFEICEGYIKELADEVYKCLMA